MRTLCGIYTQDVGIKILCINSDNYLIINIVHFFMSFIESNSFLNCENNYLYISRNSIIKILKINYFFIKELLVIE